LKSSIRANLLKRMIAPLLLINLVGAGLTFWLAWAPTRTAWDQSLADAAWALIPRLRENAGVVTIDLPHQAEQVLRVDHFDSIFFVVRDAAGRTLAGDHDFPALAPLARVDEPQVYEGTMRGEPVRIVNLRAGVGTATVYIGAAETKRKRQESRGRIIAALLLIEILLTCVAVAIVWTAVRRGLLPLQRMQDDLNRRQVIDLAPLAVAGAPVELEPLIGALNGLLERTRAGATAQQTFLANIISNGSSSAIPTTLHCARRPT
jgi:two-component system sensor histidine kinase TctE